MENTGHPYPETRRIALYARAIRVHQWIKNVLIFVPLIAAHRLQEGPLLLQGVIAFLCFSFASSAVYLFNDLIDLEADRQHPFNKYRPLAAGQIPLWQGALLIPVLLTTAFTVGWGLSVNFVGVLLGYCVLNVAYSWQLKQVPILDVLVLASF